jgi:hypothetical protein
MHEKLLSQVVIATTITAIVINVSLVLPAHARPDTRLPEAIAETESTWYMSFDDEFYRDRSIDTSRWNGGLEVMEGKLR